MKRDRSFVKSLTFSYLWVSLVPLTIILVVLFINTIQSSQEEAQEKNETAAKLITSQIDALVENMTFLSIHLTNNIMASAKGLNYSGNTLVKEEQYYSAIQSECCSYAVVDSLYDVTFFSKKGYYITSDSYNMDYNCRYRLPEEEIEKLGWLCEVNDNYGKSILLPVKTGEIPLEEKEALTLARAIRDPGNIVGYLCIQADLETVDEILRISELKEAQAMLWDDEKERMLYCTKNFPADAFGESTLEKNLEMLGSEYISISTEAEHGISVVLLSDKSDIYYASLKSIGTLCLEALALLLLTVCFIKYYTEKMTKPLNILTGQMKRMTLDTLNNGGDPQEYSYEEIRYLYNGYEEMQRRLDSMIRKEIASRTLQMQERLNSLQAQINPHFLYNTLNVIGIMGCESDNPRIYDACLKLSSILRYSIADKNAGVSTMDSELENISAYFELMKLRFEHRIEYKICCDEEIRELKLPRLCLQPFVENVFEHAYNAGHPQIDTSIVCKRAEHSVEIQIRDNGQGMEQEALERLKKTMRERIEALECGRSDEMVYGIGIENTILRMYLFFDGKFQYEIENGREGGFSIRLIIEKEREQKP